MPHIAGNFDVLPCNLLPATVDDPIETNVVLKRVGTNDVVVVTIKETNGNACRLIYASRDRFEPYGNVNVLADDWFKNSQRKTIVSSVGTRLLNYTTCK